MVVEFLNAEAQKTHKLLDPRDDDVVFIPRASTSALRYSDLVDGPVLMVTGLVDGLSAALSDAVEVGDMVLNMCTSIYVSSYYCILYICVLILLYVALSDAVEVGDMVLYMCPQVLQVDGLSTIAMDIQDVRERISGPRGSRVSLKLLRPLKNGTAFEYSVLLKRGAWGAQHAVMSGEDRDMLDQNRWPLPGALSCQKHNRQALNGQTTTH
jgi:hypothetical protein